MRISRLICIVLILSTFFGMFGCSKKNDVPNQYNNHNNNSESEQPLGASYTLNVKTKMIHLPGCHHLAKTDAEVQMPFSGDVNELINKGYSLCKSCFPPPKDETDKEEDEEPVEDNTPTIDPQDASFVINKKTLKFHEPDCSHISTISEKNIQYTDMTLEELWDLEYIPCGTCLPEEWKRYKEEHPEIE